MNEEKTRQEITETLELVEQDGIEVVARTYLVCAVNPGSRYYEIWAEISLEKYPLRKPTEEERVEVLQILRTKERLSRNMDASREFWNSELDSHMRTTPLDLTRLREKSGRSNGDQEYERQWFRGHYENDRSVRNYKQTIPTLERRLEEIAKGLIAKD